MTAKRKREENPAVEAMLDQIDFHGMTKEELDGEDGLLSQITRRFYERALQAEMDEHLGYRKNDNKALYVALAINWEGKKEVLGLWLADTEGAKFWMSVLTDIKNRGVGDILIACMDGLTGFPDAVRAVFPDTHIQHCIVHMVRSSTKFVSYKDLKAVCRDLKEVYSAINAERGHEALEAFGEKWNGKYPMIQASWERNWNDLREFFSYPDGIRRAIYTTNAIESLNFSLRKVTRNKSSFPDDDSIYKVMYLAIRNASAHWTMPIKEWGLAVNQFAILFDGRVPL